MAKLKFHGDLYENNNRVVNVSNASSATPSAPGTASAGSSTDYARADHTHAAQTTINGHTVNADVPSVSSSDNGKLLGVSNGVLAAVNAPSGVFLVTLTGSPNPTSSDKTSGEIHTAYVNGQPVIAKWNSDVYYLTDSESTYAYFQYLSGSESVYCSRIVISTNSGSTTVTRDVVQWNKSSIPDVCEFGFTYNSSNQTYTYDDNSTFGQLYEYLWYGRKIKDSNIHITYPNSISGSLPSYEIGHCCEGWFDYEEIGGESNVPIGYAKYMVYVPGNGSNISSRIKMYSLVYNLDTQDPPTLTKTLDEELGGGGGETLIVHATSVSGMNRTIDHTFTEISNAVSAGMPVYYQDYYGGDDLSYLCTINSNSIRFREVDLSSNDISRYDYVIFASSPSIATRYTVVKYLPDRFVYNFVVEVNSETGNYEVWCDGNSDIEDIINNNLNDEYQLIYTISHRDPGTSEMNYEVYKLTRFWTTTEEISGDDYTYGHLEFRCIGNTANGMVVKTFTISNQSYVYDWSLATITYTEEEMGGSLPPSASGVSF